MLMKRIVLLFVIISVISCTKEKEPDSIVGTWTLAEINSANTSSVALSQTELSVQFTEKDSLIILGPKPNYTYLQDFNRYEIVSNDKIRFFNTNTQDELFADFSINKTLSLSYQVRCPYKEKFIRH
jgi:hypothetical protein